jgi:hypothetical protein
MRLLLLLSVSGLLTVTVLVMVVVVVLASSVAVPRVDAVGQRSLQLVLGHDLHSAQPPLPPAAARLVLLLAIALSQASSK